MTCSVAIHQPNFFPWLPYFNKMATSDVFIMLDNVQFPKKGGTWINRVQINFGGKPNFITMPVVRSYHGVREIREMEIDESTPWRDRMIKTVQQFYRKTPHYQEVIRHVEGLLHLPAPNVGAFNMACLCALAELLGLDAGKMKMASEYPTDRVSTERLVHLVRAVGGDVYFSGHGAVDYQEEEIYRNAGIALIYQRYVHPIYPQMPGTAFIPGLSILDALFHAGIEKTREFIAGPQEQILPGQEVRP